MKPQKLYTLKIYSQGTSFLFNMAESDIETFKKDLKKEKWLTMTLPGENELNIHSSEIKCFEIIQGPMQRQLIKGQMTLIRLSQIMNVHPVTVSKMAAKGKIPVVSAQTARRKHSRATLETALALRENLVKLGRSVPSVEKIKEEFMR